jgi:hypothetical protein
MKPARAKPRGALTKAPKAPARPAVEAPEELLERIFADLPEPYRKHGPEVVRKNRRNRAKLRLVEALEARGAYALTETLRVDLERTARRWAEKDFADGFGEAEELEVRCAEEGEVLAAGTEAERFGLTERFHRQRVQKRYGRLEVRGLQTATRVFQDLAETYVPLMVEDRSAMLMPMTAVQTVTERKPMARLRKGKNGAASKVKAVEMEAAFFQAAEMPRVPATEATTKHVRLLIVGGPGSGKSTLAAYLATTTAENDAGPIPFVVPVRALAGAPLALRSFADAADAESWFLEAALAEGRALLLVDGLDEARREVAGEVLPALRRLVDLHHGNRVVATSRPVGEGGPAPEGFAEVRLAPMTREEVNTFIERWCLAAELSLGKVRAHAEADAKVAAADLKERVRTRRAIAKLAQTPLLCSVIGVVHRFLGQQIPQRRVILYEAITNVLLYEWDRAKFPVPEEAAIGKLDAPAKRTLLARLAYAMHEAKAAEISEAEVVRLFAEHLPDLGREASEAEEIVNEIRDRSGVLVERAPGAFAFSHLSFQEYFAALEMVNARRYEDLVARYQDEWWHEVIVLTAGFPGAEVARLVQGLLARDGKEIAQGTMLAGQCMDVAIEMPAALRSTIEDRVGKLVPPRSQDDAFRLFELGEVVAPMLVRQVEQANAQGRALSLLVLGRLRHEPALGVVAKLLSDASEVNVGNLFFEDDVNYPMVNVAAWAALTAKLIIDRSEVAYASLVQVVPQAHPEAIDVFAIIAEHLPTGRVREQLLGLVRGYEQAHVKAKPSPSRPPKRAARSG